MPAVATRASYLAYRAGADLTRRVPPALGDSIGRWVSRSAVVLWTHKRRQVRRHLRRASRGVLRGLELERRVVAVFDNYGRYWMELFRLPYLSPAQLDARCDAEGYEVLERARDGGRGAILALPHLGNWDFAGAWVAGRGFPVTVVAEPVEPPELFQWFVELREQLGMQVIGLGPEAVPQVLRALRDGRFVCLVCDRDLSRDGIEVDFFGERTSLPAGPALLALRTGAPLIPAGVFFRPVGHHRIHLLEPVPVDRTGYLSEDVARVTRALVARFEGLIGAAPEQWLVMQPNWPSDLAGWPSHRREVGL